MEYKDIFLKKLLPYQNLFILAFYIFTAIFLYYLIRTGWDAVKKAGEKRKQNEKEVFIKMDARYIPQHKRGLALRYRLSADGIDPNPLSYLVIQDGGRECYVRSFTIATLPKRTEFARTFAQLLDFPQCTSSIFVNPISDERIIRLMDNQMDILESEYVLAHNNVNRRRKLRPQIQEVSNWAESVETGNNRVFEVGFLFTLQGESIEELNKISDRFYGEALARNIRISACYGMQAEAYALNGPYNAQISAIKRKNIGCIHYLHMDKYSLSTIYNYTQTTFSHHSGVFIGRDMITHDPVIFDIFSKTHSSFSVGVFGHTGSGKSLFVKILAARNMLLGVHFVVIDSQERKGMSEGEYASLATCCGGVSFKISKDSEQVMNLFDISETIKSVKVSDDVIREERTLDLSGKITSLVNVLCSMITTDKDAGFDSFVSQTFINDILTAGVTQTYHEYGIYDGEVDSLYEDHLYGGEGRIGSKVKKKLPTISDFYKRLLTNARGNQDETLVTSYNLVIKALKPYVKELYYASESMQFLSGEEYAALPETENGKKACMVNGKEEQVEVIRGIRPYYDGQSTFTISGEVPFTNIDISQLPVVEKKLARQIALEFITENFVKKNSQSMDAEAKLVVILDEAHEMWPDPFCRRTVDIGVREARKRHVGFIISSQTVKEFDRHAETQDMLKLMEAKFVFQQDFQDMQHLVEKLGITESQAMKIVTELGGSKKDREEEKRKHAGETCLIDNKKVCFVKIDYFKNTEGLFAETDARELSKIIKVRQG